MLNVVPRTEFTFKFALEGLENPAKSIIAQVSSNIYAIKSFSVNIFKSIPKRISRPSTVILIPTIANGYPFTGVLILHWREQLEPKRSSEEGSTSTVPVQADPCL